MVLTKVACVGVALVRRSGESISDIKRLPAVWEAVVGKERGWSEIEGGGAVLVWPKH